MKIPISPVHWRTTWRLIPTHYPEKNLFSRVADPRDIASVSRLEQMTSARQASGKRRAGNVYIEAALSYLNPEGSRFSPPSSYGVYYAAKTLDTAIQEAKFHTERFMKRTQEKPMSLGRRVLIARLHGTLHDVRGLCSKMPNIYSPTHYSASQAFGLQLRKQGSQGIVYDSVRDSKGQCAAVFQAQVLSHCRQERHLIFEWNGQKVSKVFELQEYPAL